MWKENDNRFDRRVTVVAVGPTEYRDICVEPPRDYKVPEGKVLVVGIHKPRAGQAKEPHRFVLNSVSRFNGKSGGYSPLGQRS
jgi:hypothetical protein